MDCCLRDILEMSWHEHEKGWFQNLSRCKQTGASANYRYQIATRLVDFWFYHRKPHCILFLQRRIQDSIGGNTVPGRLTDYVLIKFILSGTDLRKQKRWTSDTRAQDFFCEARTKRTTVTTLFTYAVFNSNYMCN